MTPSGEVIDPNLTPLVGRIRGASIRLAPRTGTMPFGESQQLNRLFI
jgi:hypothetical protein